MEKLTKSLHLSGKRANYDPREKAVSHPNLYGSSGHLETFTKSVECKRIRICFN